jgi:hypothetical protein
MVSRLGSAITSISDCVENCSSTKSDSRERPVVDLCERFRVTTA